MQPVWTCGAAWKVNVAFDILGWKIVFLIYEIYLSISAFKWGIQLQLPSSKPQMTQMTKFASQREIQVINNATFFLISSYFTSVYRFKCNYSCLINRKKKSPQYVLIVTLPCLICTHSAPQFKIIAGEPKQAFFCLSSQLWHLIVILASGSLLLTYVSSHKAS